MIDNFNMSKWVQKQHLKEAGLNENVQSKEEAFKILRDVQSKLYDPEISHKFDIDGIGQALDFLQADEIGAMFRKEKENKY